MLIMHNAGKLAFGAVEFKTRPYDVIADCVFSASLNEILDVFSFC